MGTCEVFDPSAQFQPYTWTNFENFEKISSPVNLEALCGFARRDQVRTTFLEISDKSVRLELCARVNALTEPRYSMWMCKRASISNVCIHTRQDNSLTHILYLGSSTVRTRNFSMYTVGTVRSAKVKKQIIQSKAESQQIAVWRLLY